VSGEFLSWQAPLSISRAWLKKKRATPTDANGYWRWRAFIVPSPRIIPGIPTGYKGNGAALPVTRAERWKARAEECRTLADCFTDPICRGQLTRLAQGYDQMAVAAE
jgi:hypothetical protein